MKLFKKMNGSLDYVRRHIDFLEVSLKKAYERIANLEEFSSQIIRAIEKIGFGLSVESAALNSKELQLMSNNPKYLEYMAILIAAIKAVNDNKE